VRAEVARVHGVDLHTEVRLIGFPDDDDDQPSASSRGL
jgi:hypothetical protein